MMGVLSHQSKIQLLAIVFDAARKQLLANQEEVQTARICDNSGTPNPNAAFLIVRRSCRSHRHRPEISDLLIAYADTLRS